jgi:hypothetical protein
MYCTIDKLTSRLAVYVLWYGACLTRLESFDSYSCTIGTLPFYAKIVRIAVYVIWYGA